MLSRPRCGCALPPLHVAVCVLQVSWEECWWQASDRYGLKELGAFKKGTTAGGAAWREEWKELIYPHHINKRQAIDRTAHK